MIIENVCDVKIRNKGQIIEESKYDTFDGIFNADENELNKDYDYLVVRKATESELDNLINKDDNLDKIVFATVFKIINDKLYGSPTLCFKDDYYNAYLKFNRKLNNMLTENK